MLFMEAEKKIQFQKRTEYQKRWESFKSQIHTYDTTRNFDLGPSGHHTTVSCLSAWITHRTITERELLKELDQQSPNPGVDKWKDELIWRLYFRSYMWRHQGIWHALRSAMNPQEIALESAPETGIPAFNAWVRELETTGYLHNHARMWFASIWIFSLGLDWKAGAMWMYTRLLDGDISSNTLGWRWVAGLHTKGKAYHAASSNMLRFTRGRFSDYTLPSRKAHCLTELPIEVHPDAHLKEVKLQPDIPLGLVCHPMDLSGRLPGDTDQSKLRVVVPLNTRRASPLDLGSHSIDMPQVAKELFPDVIAVMDETNEKPLTDLLQSLATKHSVDAWVTPFPGVGPFMDIFLNYKKYAAKNNLLPLYFITDPLDLYIFKIKESSYFGFQRKFKKGLKAGVLDADVLFTDLVQRTT